MSDFDFVTQLRKAFGFAESPKEKSPRGIKADLGRLAEIRRLRFVEKWTLQEIANKYGISRERIRQIVGNSGAGYKQERIRKVVRSHPELTNEQLAGRLGVGEASITKRRGGMRHAIKPGSLAKGTGVEDKVSEILKANGINHKLMPHKHPFDILLGNGKRADVKSAHKLMQPKSLAKYPYYSFNTGRKEKIGSCDFFVLVIVPTMELFIVPSQDVKSQLHIPATAKRKSKWEGYKNRFDLLKE